MAYLENMDDFKLYMICIMALFDKVKHVGKQLGQKTKRRLEHGDYILLEVDG